MKVYYLNRHATCPHYIGNRPIGFSLTDALAGEHKQLDTRFSAMVFVLRGKLSLHGQFFGTLEVPANQMFVMPAGIPHDMYFEEDTKGLQLYFIGDKLNFCSRIFTEQYAKEDDAKPGLLSTLAMKPTLRKFVELMCSYIRDGLLCCSIHKLKQDELAAVLQAYYSPDVLVPFLAPLQLANNEFFDRVLAMAQDYLTIEQMAERLNMSRSTFIRQFDGFFKEPPSKWLARVKMTDLFRALRQSDVPLVQIADRFKFASQQSMSAFCKSKFGYSPMQVRAGDFIPPVLQK